MPRFSYIATNAAGTEQTGVLDAFDVPQVATLLREQGLFPLEVIAATGDKVSADPAAHRGFAILRHLSSGLRLGRVRTKELAVFTRQLGTLLHAGMPLLRSLTVLGRQEKNTRFRTVIEAMSESIKSGATLSEAMAQHDRIFDRLYINMIRAGEAGGLLDTVLDRLARFQEKSLHLRGKLTTAMVYPVIVLAVAVAIFCGLLVYVVPKFQQIFADMLKGAPLPRLTQLVLDASDLVRHNLLLMAGVMVTLGVGFRLFRRSTVGSRWIDALLGHIPVLGDLILKAVVARFSRTLGTLLASGVPILSALLITRDTCGHSLVAEAITTVHDRVKEGSPVARPLEATAVFPPMVNSMVEVGEHSGELAPMLNKIADIYEDEVDHAVANISALIEPVLILFLALVVGTIVIALFLPIIRIIQLVG